MPKFLNDVDINKNQLQNPVIHPSATAPSSPKQGQIYFDTTDNNIYRYDGTQWVTYQNELDTAATNIISIDSAPALGSSNLVTSGGVYTAIQNIPSPPVTSVNTQTGAVVLDADDIDYDSTYTVKGKIDTIIASGGEPNVIESVEVNGTALTVTDKTVDVPVPTSNSSATTGISIADHSTTTITGVSGSTSVIGVQSTTTTASKVTLGTAISVPNVTDVGSASNWEFENVTVPIKDSSSKTIPNVTAAGSGSFTQGSFSGGSFTQGTDSFTANTPTAINTSKFNGGSFTRGSFSGGSFTQGSFSGGSLTITNDTTTDANHHILTFAFSPATHANDTFTAATHANDSFTPASLASGFYTAGTAASFTQGEDEFTPATHGADSHTHTPPTLGTAFTITGVQSTTTTASHVKSGGNGTAPTLGTAISVPNVTGATDVTVPIKDTSSTTVPTAASSATTVVTSKTHSVTDNGHTHTLVVPE